MFAARSWRALIVERLFTTAVSVSGWVPSNARFAIRFTFTTNQGAGTSVAIGWGYCYFVVVYPLFQLE